MRGHREQDPSNDVGRNFDTERAMQRGNFLAIKNLFATLDDVLMGHLEKDTKNAKMWQIQNDNLWQIQNDIIKCLSEFVWSKIKDEIPDYYAIITDKVTGRFSSKEFNHFLYIV